MEADGFTDRVGVERFERGHDAEGHTPGGLERLPVFGSTRKHDAHAVRDLVRAHLVAVAGSPVDEDGHRAWGFAQDPSVHSAPF